MTFQSAVSGPDGSVHYFDNTDTITVYQGGSRSWRTHNPGLIGLGLFAYQHGAIGKIASVMAFGDYAAGKRALIELLGEEEFHYLTVGQAYKRFDIAYTLPTTDYNDPTRPAAAPPTRQCPHTGLDASTLMHTLGAADRRRMADVIEQHVIGYSEGTITRETKAVGRLNRAAQAVPASNVLINKRTAVHAGSQGTLLTPDVCETPTGDGCKKVLYMNTAVSADASGAAATVRINGHPVCHRESVFAQSSGDEAGVCGGIISGTIRGRAQFITAASNVFMEGIEAVRAYDLMTSNNLNTPPMPLMQPGAPPPPAVAAARVDEQPETPAPCGVRLDIAAAGKRWLPGQLRLRDGETEWARALASDVEPGSSDPMPIVGLPETVSPRLELVMPNVGEGATVVPIADDVEAVSVDYANDPELDERAERYVLVPVRFRRYLTAERDAPSTGPIRPGGWLYVFREGALWREIRVTREGYYRDVDLPHQRGEDRRHAVAVAQSHVLLPQRLDGVGQSVAIAFSEIQWSWSQIAALEDNAERRAARCQVFDLNVANTRDRLTESADTMLVLDDAFAVARELSQHQQSLRALMERTAPAKVTGEYALARTVKAIIDSDAEARKPRQAQYPEQRPTGEGLAEHVDRDKLERTLADWEGFDQRLTDSHTAAAEALIAYLESAPFRAAARDYFDQDEAHRALLGVVHFSELIGAVSVPQARAYVASGLQGQRPELTWIGAPSEATTQGLQDLALGRLTLNVGDDDLAALDTATRLKTAVDAGESLDRLVGAIAEAHLAGAKPQAAVEALAVLVTRYVGVEIGVVQPSLASLMVSPETAAMGRFTYQPRSVREVVIALKGVRVPQLTTVDGGWPTSAAAIKNDPLYWGGFYGVLGVLHGVNATVATRALVGELDMKNSLGLGAAWSGLTAFFAERFEVIFEGLTAVAETRTTALESRMPALQAQRRGASTLQRQAIERELHLLDEEARLLGTLGGRSGRLAGLADFTRRIAGPLAAGFDTALGAWDLSEGIASGNAAVAAGGGLRGVGGTLAFGALMWGWGSGVVVTGALTLNPFLLVGGVTIALVGAVLAAYGSYRELEQALRHSRFGKYPYASSYDGFSAPLARPLGDPQLLAGNELELADFEPELDELYRLLFAFRATLSVKRERIVAYVAADSSAPSSDEVIVEGRLDLNQCLPYKTAVEAELSLAQWAPLWRDQPTRTLRIGDPGLRVMESRDGERLVALSFLARVPNEWVQGGVVFRARVDADGSGRFRVPKDGGKEECTWDPHAFRPDAYGEAMSRQEWQRIVATTMPAPEKPDVWTTDEACVVVAPGESPPSFDLNR